MAFLVGANLPWLCYGCDFGASAWQTEGGLARKVRDRERAREALRSLAASGAKAVRWFVLCDGRAGVVRDSAGDLLGLDDRVLPDLDAAMDLLAEAGLQAIFVLLDFAWCSPVSIVNGVPTGGLARSIESRTGRRRLIGRVIAPILERYGSSQAILAWEVINEPEWIVTRRPLLRRGRVPLWKMRMFVREVAAVVHARTRHQVTLGSASAATLPLFAGLGLDFHEVHWYDQVAGKFPLERPVSEFSLDRPVLLGEFPTRSSALTTGQIIRMAQQSGYMGAFAWSVIRKDEVSDREALEDGIRAFW